VQNVQNALKMMDLDFLCKKGQRTLGIIRKRMGPQKRHQICTNSAKTEIKNIFFEKK